MQIYPGISGSAAIKKIRCKVNMPRLERKRPTGSGGLPAVVPETSGEAERRGIFLSPVHVTDSKSGSMQLSTYSAGYEEAIIHDLHGRGRLDGHGRRSNH